MPIIKNSRDLENELSFHINNKEDINKIWFLLDELNSFLHSKNLKIVKLQISKRK